MTAATGERSGFVPLPPVGRAVAEGATFLWCCWTGSRRLGELSVVCTLPCVVHGLLVMLVGVLSGAERRLGGLSIVCTLTCVLHRLLVMLGGGAERRLGGLSIICTLFGVLHILLVVMPVGVLGGAERRLGGLSIVCTLPGLLVMLADVLSGAERRRSLVSQKRRLKSEIGSSAGVSGHRNVPKAGLVGIRSRTNNVTSSYRTR